MVSGHTHVCIICWRRMNATRDWKRNGAFLTTVPNEHNRKYHADAEGEDQGRLDASAKRKAGAVLFGGSSSAGPPPPLSSAMAAFYVSPKDKALASAAHYYINSKGRVSKETFDDPVFRDMTQAYYEAGGGKGKAPMLTTKGLKAWVDAECAVFQTFARLTIDRLLEYSLGNPPGQGIHDCATLDNKDKYMSTGFEFIPPELDANIVLCTGMREIDGVCVERGIRFVFVSNSSH